MQGWSTPSWIQCPRGLSSHLDIIWIRIQHMVRYSYGSSVWLDIMGILIQRLVCYGSGSAGNGGWYILDMTFWLLVYESLYQIQILIGAWYGPWIFHKKLLFLFCFFEISQFCIFLLPFFYNLQNLSLPVMVVGLRGCLTSQIPTWPSLLPPHRIPLWAHNDMLIILGHTVCKRCN